MYRTFKIISIITILVSVIFILSLKHQTRNIFWDFFNGFIVVYFIITFVMMLIFLLKDRKVIFVRGFRLKNSFLYVLTTPIPLCLYFIIPFYFQGVRDSFHLEKNINEFTICENCIKEGELIEIIQISGGPRFNNNSEFYYHSIGIATSTGDTLNILTTARPFITKDNTKRHFSKSMLKIIENLQELDSSSNINDLKLKQIDKVVFDIPYKNENDRYNTVIGEYVFISDLK